MVTVCVWSLAGAPARGGTQRWLLLRGHERTREDAAPWLGAGAALVPPGGAGGPHAGAVRGTGSHPRSWGLDADTCASHYWGSVDPVLAKPLSMLSPGGPRAP